MPEENNIQEDIVVFGPPSTEDTSSSGQDDIQLETGEPSNTTDDGGATDSVNGSEAQATEVPNESTSSSAPEQTDHSEALSQYGLKSVDELVTEYGKLKDAPPQPPQIEDEFVQRYLEFTSKGGDKDTFLKTVSVDYESMDTIDILRNQYLLENPDVDSTKASKLFDLEFDQKYGYDPDYVDDSEKELKDLKLEMEREKALSSLKEHQESILKVPESASTPDNNELSEQEAKFVESYNSELKDLMSKFDSVEYMVDDKTENRFVYNPDADVKAKVNELLSVPYVNPSDDPEMFMKTLTGQVYFDGEGNIDLNKAKDIMAFVANPNSYRQKLFEHGVKKGQENHIISRKNISTTTKDDSFDGGGEASVDDVVFSSSRNRGRNSRW